MLVWELSSGQQISLKAQKTLDQKKQECREADYLLVEVIVLVISTGKASASCEVLAIRGVWKAKQRCNT